MQVLLKPRKVPALGWVTTMPFALITTPPPTGTADVFTRAPGGGGAGAGVGDDSVAFAVALVPAGDPLALADGVARPSGVFVDGALPGVRGLDGAVVLGDGSTEPVPVGAADGGEPVGAPLVTFSAPDSDPPQAATNGAAHAAQSSARRVGWTSSC